MLFSCKSIWFALVTSVIISLGLLYFSLNSPQDEIKSSFQYNDKNIPTYDIQIPDSRTHLINNLSRELALANEKIKKLEEKMQGFDERIKKPYPNVKYLNYRSKKRILVTGGAGFVGSHLIDKLMKAGHDITVVDNFFTGVKANVEQWIGHANFELIHQDIVNPLFVEVDEIYHLASPASPPHYMFNPVKTIKTNTIGTINMLGPRACYDEGKRVSETLSYAYAKHEKVSVRVARIFNTYGPRMHMDDGRVVSNFIVQALRNESITVYGCGNQTRSFQFVSDLVDGLISLMESNYTQPVNLGNPTEHTINEFAIIIKDLVGGKSKIITTPAVEDDPQRRKPDITRAMTYLNWKPRVGLKEGLKITIGHFRKELRKSQNKFK
ncbi:UDP-glucuronic acid decarboxylase 1 isoform X3 [Daktulosphaira vitifoliae]|uniref:UDP-glucuronic acid decarboxylase 1 isoform X3 n=1 Tax=Daktulosphaira vitifoliae TaxID=58002 RepID=UPI0021AA4FE5|nr:UDP-glucuronic acid decarboxylase 1 isoform X3 [Daktulosphaira vitifoliae]